jgi:hypothetical protein
MRRHGGELGRVQKTGKVECISMKENVRGFVRKKGKKEKKRGTEKKNVRAEEVII